MARTKTTAKKTSQLELPRRERIQKNINRATQKDKPKPVAKKKFRPGTKVLAQIRKYQQAEFLMIRKRPFQRLVRTILNNYSKVGQDLRIQPSALLAMQQAVEAYMTSIFQDANLCAVHAKRITVMRRDLQLANRIRDDQSLRYR